MKLTGRGNLISQGEYQNKETKVMYYSAIFVDENGDQLKVSLDKPLDKNEFPQFCAVNFTVDVKVNTKFTSLNLVNISKIK